MWKSVSPHRKSKRSIREEDKKIPDWRVGGKVGRKMERKRQRE